MGGLCLKKQLSVYFVAWGAMCEGSARDKWRFTDILQVFSYLSTVRVCKAKRLAKDTCDGIVFTKTSIHG